MTRRFRMIVGTAAVVTVLAAVAPASAQSDPYPPAEQVPTPRSAERLTPFPEQPECVGWPTDRWRRGPLSSEIDRADLDEVSSRFEQLGGRAIVIVHGGRLVYEWYRRGIGPATVNNSFSVSKSITGTVAGTMVLDGTIADVEAPAPVPEWTSPGDPRAAITWHHLMGMRPGLRWNESYDFRDPGNDIINSIASGDAGGWVAEQPLVAEPGSAYNYSTGTTNLLARTLGQQLGLTGDAIKAEVRARLFDPLGIGEVRMGTDASGHWLGGFTTDMSTRDFARYGLFHLRGGRWEDKQLLPDGWVSRVGSDGNRTQFWAGPADRFAAIGLRGQMVFVAKDLDLVVAVNSDSGRPGELLFEQIFGFADQEPCGRRVTMHRPLDDPDRVFRAGQSIVTRFSVSRAPAGFAVDAEVSSRRVHCRTAKGRPGRSVDVPGRVRQRADGKYRIEWPTRSNWRGCRELRIQLPDGTVSTTRVRFGAA